MVAAFIPRPAMMALASILGNIYFCLDKKRSELLRERLHFIMADRINTYNVDKVIRHSFVELVKNQVETILFKKLNPDNISSITDIEGEHFLKDALALGKGVIFLNGHFGNFQMIIAALGHRGYRVGQLALRIDEDREKYIEQDTLLSPEHRKSLQIRQKMEADLPVTFLHVKKFMRPIFRLLQENGILIIAGDGRQGSGFTRSSFFDHQANFSLGAFDLARRTGAVILPTLTTRIKDNQHRIHIFKPFQIAQGQHVEQNNIEALQQYIALLEEYVRRYPCHYLQYLGRCILYLREDEQPLFLNKTKESNPL